MELQAWTMFIERKGMWPEKRASQHPTVVRGLSVPEGWRQANKGDMERKTSRRLRQ